MAKKAKKKLHPMPKLGWKDQLLYWTVFILTGAGSLVSLFFPIYYRWTLSVGADNVISYADGKGNANALWLALWLFVVWLIVFAGFYQKRYPIFGRKDIKYGPPAYPRVYPLLMKNKPQYWVSPKKIARNRKLAVIVPCVLVCTLMFSIAMYPRSLYGRYELLRSGSVVEYDTRNQIAEEYHLGQIESVSLGTHRTSGGRYSSGSWYASFAITFTDGKRCSFSIRPMGESWTEAIATAQQLKQIYGDLLHIEGQDDLWKVVLDTDMTEEEAQMLYRLYEAE